MKNVRVRKTRESYITLEFKEQFAGSHKTIIKCS